MMTEYVKKTVLGIYSGNAGTPPADSRCFTYRQKDLLCRVPLGDILFFESNIRKVRVFTANWIRWKPSSQAPIFSGYIILFWLIWIR